MSGRLTARSVVVAVLVPIVIVAGLLLGRWAGSGDDGTSTSGGGVVSDVGDDAVFQHDYVIPLGTAARIDAGEEVEIVPAELVVEVGDAIRIVNEDTDGHIVGVFYVGAGETLTQRFDEPAVLEGECSVHPSGSFTLRIVDT